MSLIFVIEIINLRKNYDNFNLFINKIIILLTLIVGLKLFFLLYIVFIIILFTSDNRQKLHLLKKIFNKLFYLSLISFVLYISIYFINTGCLFFPVSFSCLENFAWSIEVDRVKAYQLHYENCQKQVREHKKNDNPITYVKFFNWVPNWIDKYFFNKVSDFLLGIIFLSIIFIIFFLEEKIMI